MVNVTHDDNDRSAWDSFATRNTLSANLSQTVSGNFSYVVRLLVSQLSNEAKVFGNNRGSFKIDAFIQRRQNTAAHELLHNLGHG